METASNCALTLTYDLELAKSVDVNQVHVSVSLYDGGRMVYFGTLEVPENATTITVPYTGAFDSGKLYVLDQQYAPMASALRLEVAS